MAWNDDSLPGRPLVSYMTTDTLWALHALQTSNSAHQSMALQMKSTLVNAGWYGNRLHDSIFRDVGTQQFNIINFTTDIGHGTLLNANCPSTDGSRTTQVRVFQTDSNINSQTLVDQFVDSAVYRALDRFWDSSTRQQAVLDLSNVINKTSSTDQVYWDTSLKVFVDAASTNNSTTYMSATYKIGLVLYAMKVMGVSGAHNADMQRRLREAQHAGTGDDAGGLAHMVTYNRSTGAITRTRPTGEATSIAILAQTVNRWP